MIGVVVPLVMAELGWLQTIIVSDCFHFGTALSVSSNTANCTPSPICYVIHISVVDTPVRAGHAFGPANSIVIQISGGTERIGKTAQLACKRVLVGDGVVTCSH